MLSRVAENVYWMSRYVERAENVARLLDAGFFHELDAAGLGGEGRGPIDSILAILACRGDFERKHGRGDRDAVLRFLTFDKQVPHSMLGLIARARENARGTQEALSAESWSQLNTLYLYLSSPRAQRRYASSPSRFLEGVKRSCILFGGLIDSTLSRSECYHFLQLGRHLERVNQVCRILDAKCRALNSGGSATDPALGPVHWASLLRSCSAYDAYLREFQERIDGESVVRYLVLDADFPRAVRFCVARCQESLHEIGGGDEDAYSSEAERRLGRLDGELRYIDVGEIFERGLSNFLGGVTEACNRVGDEIHQAYFFT